MATVKTLFWFSVSVALHKCSTLALQKFIISDKCFTKYPNLGDILYSQTNIYSMQPILTRATLMNTDKKKTIIRAL